MKIISPYDGLVNMAILFFFAFFFCNFLITFQFFNNLNFFSKAQFFLTYQIYYIHNLIHHYILL
ncbi:MAG TPA: hypothetical protein DDX29_04535 [Clostridiales bacterium]|nr:hypothetical protein [Clostridiales bacterium]